MGKIVGFPQIFLGEIVGFPQIFLGEIVGFPQILGVDAAEVEGDFGGVGGEGFEWGVGHEEDYDVGLAEGFVIVREVEKAVFGEVWFGNHDFRVVAEFHDFADNVDCGRFAQIVNVRFEGESHHSNFRASFMFPFEIIDALFDFFDTPLGFVSVDFAGLLNEGRFVGEVGDEEVGVDGNAVATDSASGVEDVDSGVEIGEGDEVPDVDIGIMANY